jgi:hypothetical protein
MREHLFSENRNPDDVCCAKFAQLSSNIWDSFDVIFEVRLSIGIFNNI